MYLKVENKIANGIALCRSMDLFNFFSSLVLLLLFIHDLFLLFFIVQF